MPSAVPDDAGTDSKNAARTVPPIALTIAGSNSSGGAGIQADLKTFTALGVHGASVITALTAQNSRGVSAIEAVPPAFVRAQFTAVVTDLKVAAIKTGMLGTTPLVREVAAMLRNGTRAIPLIVDPVMVATSGDQLLAPDAVQAVRDDLFPLAALVTPNLPEAARLLDAPIATSRVDMIAQAKAILALGPGAVLIKGGHATEAGCSAGTSGNAADLLYDGRDIYWEERPWVDTRNTHGTGCTLSAAIAALMACGAPLSKAVAGAKEFVWQALRNGKGLDLGAGRGPVDHLFAIKRNTGSPGSE